MNCRRSSTNPAVPALALLCALVGLSLAPAVPAKDAAASGQVKSKEFDDITSDDFDGHRVLILKAQQALRHGAYERAVKHMERAMTTGQKDVDVHYFYAMALEQKMEKAHFRDQDSFSKCVNSWLKIYRGEVGDEKGLTIKGIGLAAGAFSNDEMAAQGKEHLLSLVGFLPKAWESDAKYVKRAVATLGQASHH
ncbi:MAG: hypothetical protein HY986_04810 [Candidatus Melainabacteria bacterium]|nr:hypothetical protein [Candidatus Melainabacteria bacterium]